MDVRLQFILRKVKQRDAQTLEFDEYLRNCFAANTVLLITLKSFFLNCKTVFSLGLKFFLGHFGELPVLITFKVVQIAILLSFFVATAAIKFV